LLHIGSQRINFSPNIFFHSFEKNYGDNLAVSDIVIEGSKLIKKINKSNFNLSNKLYSNSYFKQRIVEFSYPIRLDTNSQFVLALSHEEFSCSVRLKTQRLKLYEC
jgi:polyphosphate kinase